MAWVSILVVAFLLWPAGSEGAVAAAAEAADPYNPAFYRLQELNAGLGAPAAEPNLATPQAALEYFIARARSEDYAGAARALNLNLIARERQSKAAPQLARKLLAVLDAELRIDWESIPDRPDAQVEARWKEPDPMAGEPRRSILVERLGLNGRDAAIRLERVKVGGDAPRWVFSPQTVENIPELYDRYGPGRLSRLVPGWVKLRLSGGMPVWEWLAAAALAALSAAVGAGLRRLVRLTLCRRGGEWPRRLARAACTPLAVVLALLLFQALSTALLSLSGPLGGLVSPTVMVLIVVAGTWLAVRLTQVAADFASQRATQRLKRKGEDAWKPPMLTYISVARRVGVFVVVIIGLGIGLRQFPGFETAGLSLLASAGVASVVVGIAAQGFLGNVIAGVQIALSRPVSIGDNVVFEDNWGYIEDITYTYVLLRTWDLKRLVIPLRHFMSHPFHNYTMHDASTVMSVYLYVDYRTDIDALRRRYEELLRDDEDWDRSLEPYLLVTAAREQSLEIRAVCSARDPVRAFFLHCRLRESLIRYLRELEEGSYLPRQRLAVVEGCERADRLAREEAAASG
jgi:small-conductance mechanosensitive channel